jgi:hypothetical protein
VFLEDRWQEDVTTSSASIHGAIAAGDAKSVVNQCQSFWDEVAI